jgi:hypothetical protein
MQMKNRRERTFFEWWNSIPTELKKEPNYDYNNNENSENIVNSINYILLKTDIYNMNNIKPTIEELKYWVYSGQIKNSVYRSKKRSKK